MLAAFVSTNCLRPIGANKIIVCSSRSVSRSNAGRPLSVFERVWTAIKDVGS